MMMYHHACCTGLREIGHVFDFQCNFRHRLVLHREYCVALYAKTKDKLARHSKSKKVTPVHTSIVGAAGAEYVVFCEVKVDV